MNRVVHLRPDSDERVDAIDMPHRRLEGFDFYWVAHDEQRYGGWHRGANPQPQAWFVQGGNDRVDLDPPQSLDDVINIGNVSVYEGP